MNFKCSDDITTYNYPEAIIRDFKRIEVILKNMYGFMCERDFEEWFAYCDICTAVERLHDIIVDRSKYKPEVDDRAEVWRIDHEID